MLATFVFFAVTAQSYLAFDSGGTTIRENDAITIQGRVNLPVYPNDTITTSASGRAEVRLADGNVMGVDRGTAVNLFSVLGSWEGHSDDTVLSLRSGRIMIWRRPDSHYRFTIYTNNTRYFADVEAVFSVETDGKGRDRLEVFDGYVDVRKVCPVGRFGPDVQGPLDDFEIWFLSRPWRFGERDELAEYGSWIDIAGYGKAWRPHNVSFEWRPYSDGSWRLSRYGYLNWISYEPWGWIPYHYGRWAYEPAHGWFWVPGAEYSPAWVYWWYGPDYVGWAPAGFYGDPPRESIFPWARVNANEIDLFPWTFADRKTLAPIAVTPDGVGVIAMKPIRQDMSPPRVVQWLPDLTKFFSGRGRPRPQRSGILPDR